MSENMKDRIQINGEWYVKESHLQVDSIIRDYMLEDLLFTKCCLWEGADWMFEASLILKDDGKDLNNHLKTINIEITDKRPTLREEWKTEFIDNPAWLRGVCNNNPSSLKEADKIFDEDNI